jgi:hypothetical protein
MGADLGRTWRTWRRGEQWSRRLHGDERGVVTVIAALLMTALMGMLALTVDIGNGYGQRRMAQNAVDSAAINAAVVVAKRIKAISPTEFRDSHVVAAIQTVAGHTSGGFSWGAGSLTARYVRRNPSSLAIEELQPVGTGELCPDGITPGCIPQNATGVRVHAAKTFNTLFAPVFNQTQLTTGARATALNGVVISMSRNSPGLAPYALWTGESGRNGDGPWGTGDLVEREMSDDSNPPDYLCRVAGTTLPKVLTVRGATVPVDFGYRSVAGAPYDGPTLPGQAYDFSCQAGTDRPIAPGAQFIIRVSSKWDERNVSVNVTDNTVTNPNWQVSTANNFKGFIRIDDPRGLVGIGDYVSDGGVAGGNDDAVKPIISACYQADCELVMPLASYAKPDSGDGHPLLLITGFAKMKIGPGINSQDPGTAPTSYEWKARVVNAPVLCCPVEIDDINVIGTTQLLYTRLVE